MVSRTSSEHPNFEFHARVVIVGNLFLTIGMKTNSSSPGGRTPQLLQLSSHSAQSSCVFGALANISCSCSSSWTATLSWSASISIAIRILRSTENCAEFWKSNFSEARNIVSKIGRPSIFPRNIHPYVLGFTEYWFCVGTQWRVNRIFTGYFYQERRHSYFHLYGLNHWSTKRLNHLRAQTKLFYRRKMGHNSQRILAKIEFLSRKFRIV